MVWSKAPIKGDCPKHTEQTSNLHQSADEQDAEIKTKTAHENITSLEGSIGGDVDKLSLKFGAKDERKAKAEVEQSFKIHREKLQELDRWLPQLKKAFGISLVSPQRQSA